MEHSYLVGMGCDHVYLDGNGCCQPGDAHTPSGQLYFDDRRRAQSHYKAVNHQDLETRTS